MGIVMEDVAPNNRLQEWVELEDQKRLEEMKVQDANPDVPIHSTLTWALLGTPTIELSQF
ncbi:hypothetical protein [Pseudalkalibacillus hwajinpoensis]|uniref:Uncharacterized protein n=1 Tax=Guptibacillus hwajinpoensis TaxID=208199 RepID=A0A4U1MG54_9BACL|nr:hypothetical protein [Pseudalkalibacillus hwajinpoensis]TKD69372.1 hypothetical protein FBF83_15390 [Pseudalkalibacillus hwajinpoensis]